MTVVLPHEIHGCGCGNTQHTQYSKKAFPVHIYIVLHKVTVLDFKCNYVMAGYFKGKRPMGIASYGNWPHTSNFYEISKILNKHFF